MTLCATIAGADNRVEVAGQVQGTVASDGKSVRRALLTRRASRSNIPMPLCAPTSIRPHPATSATA